MSDQVTQADTGVQPLEGERYRTLANGARQDLVTGKIVAGAVIDRDRGREMVRAREEKRIRLYTEGAGRAVQDTQLIREYGKDAHIVERGMTLQQIATTPDAGKAAVMAAQALDVAQGLIVKGKPETDAPTDGDPARILGAMLIEYMRGRLGGDSADGEA